MAWSPDGRTLVSASEDSSVRVWDVRDGKCLKVCLGHTAWVWSVAFSPDGKTLASGSQDCSVRLWDVNTGECLNVLQGHTKEVYSVAYGLSAGYTNRSDSSVLATSSQDETIKLWDVKTGKCLKTLRAKRLYEGMNITGVRGVREAQKVTLKALGAVEISE